MSVLTLVAVLALLGCSTSNATGSSANNGHAAQQAAKPARAASTVAQRPADELPVLTFTAKSAATVPLTVEIADSEALRETGLMNRTSMADDHGMIFMFTREVDVAFYMKDTLIDLSVAFIDSQGTIVDIQEMQAQTLDNHFPAMPYQFAVEANAGWYTRNKIAVGDTVDVSQALQKSPVFGGAPVTASPTP